MLFQEIGCAILLVFAALPYAVLCKDYFTAAVFEHRPRACNGSGLSPKEIISSNLQFYVKAAELASKQGADIIVFNEYGLYPYPATRENFKNFAENVPDPRKFKFNPCTANAKDRQILYAISCLARENRIHIVVNMADVHQCEGTCDTSKIEGCENNCPNDGHFFYNTDVVFDTEGNIIARYHKMHPYFEHVNVPDEPEFITFETNFGKFGLAICFDSVFEETMQLAKNYNIDALLFPTYWFDDIVPFNGVEWQQSWALANGVNFIAANTQAPSTGSLGSGIYSKKDGALVYTYEPDGQSKLLVANVRLGGSSEIPEKKAVFIVTQDGVFPKVETGEKFPEQGYEKIAGPAVEKYLDYRYFKSQTENYTKVKLQDPSGKAQACNNGFCCSLSYTAQSMQEDFYLVAFSGKNHVRGYFEWWEENCLLIRCDSFGNEACVVQPPTSKTVFTHVKLYARFSDGVIYPTVSKNHFRLAPKTEWSFKTENVGTKLTFKSTSDEPLLKVGLLGRIYENDPPFIPFHQF